MPGRSPAPPRDHRALETRIATLGLEASAGDDPGTLGDRIARTLREATGVAFVGIALPDPGGGELRVRWGAARRGIAVPRRARVPFGHGLVGRAAATGEPQSGSAADPEWQPLARGQRVALATPLLSGGAVRAVLLLEAPGTRLGPGVTAAVSRVTPVLAAAVHNILVLEEGRHRLAQLAVLGRVSRIATSTVDLDELLQRTVECIREELGYGLVAIGLVDERQRRIVLHALSSAAPLSAQIGHSQAFGEGVTGDVAASGRSLLVADVQAWSNYVPVAPSLRSEMCCPLRVGERIIGCLDAEAECPGRFGASDLVLFETIADHISQAVQNARALRQVAQLREELTAMLVHDLRHPLTVILAELDLVAAALRRQGLETSAAPTRRAQAAAEEMLVQIGGLLDLQRLEAGALQARPRACVAGDVVTAVVERLGAVARTRQVTLQATVAAETPAAWLDTDLVTRVLENLVVNALKFTPAGGEVRVAVGPAIADGADPAEIGALRFSVCDTGPGIPPALRQRIFDKFVTGAGEAGDRPRSTGLGLAFCRAAVDAHGGRIWVDPAPESGSAFHFQLPLRPTAAPAASRGAAPATPTARAARRRS